MNNKVPFGIIAIDKPEKLTSFQVIWNLRKITGIKKIGHTGTLDPFATGLLPILIGKATRMSNYITSLSKTYRTVLKFGIKTDSGDITGKIIEQQEVSEIKEIALKKLVTDILEIKSQKPPIFSAIKINGQRAYKLARKGESFDLKERPIKIESFKIIDYQHPFLTYEAKVTKGTYIRVLSQTIAEMLGTIATTTELRRTNIDDFSISKAIALSDLNADNWQNFLLPITSMMKDYPSIILSENLKVDYRNGIYIQVESDDFDLVIVKDAREEICGLGVVENKILKPKTVLI